MTIENQKKLAAEAALQYVEQDAIIGVGTGSTVNFFIDALASIKQNIEGTVASSEASAKRLKSHGIPVYDLNAVDSIAVYVDGADEFDSHKHMIKGGGGAHTREKIVAAASKKFICIVNDGKQVDVLSTNMPVPIEVIPMARSFVGREIVKMGGSPSYRDGFVTDNGNIIIDAYNLKLLEPLAVEQSLNSIPGVVENGIFAAQAADIILVASDSGVTTLS